MLNEHDTTSVESLSRAHARSLLDLDQFTFTSTLVNCWQWASGTSHWPGTRTVLNLRNVARIHASLVHELGHNPGAGHESVVRFGSRGRAVWELDWLDNHNGVNPLGGGFREYGGK